MNERIKELMVQVCKEQGLPFTVEHNRAYMLDNFSEKFAELIVKECISKVTKVSDSIKEFDSGNADGIDLCDLITYHIKKDFGVEK